MTLPRPICVRLAADLEARLEAFFRERGWGPSEGMRHVVREWVALDAHAWLEFRDTPFGRRAAIRGGPEVWELIQTWERVGRDQDRLYRHFGWLEPTAIDEALAYYRGFPEAVDQVLERNARFELASGDEGRLA